MYSNSGGVTLLENAPMAWLLVRCFACAVSWATWLLFTGVPARCVVLLVRCPGPLGCCSPVCPLGALCCLYSVLGNLDPVHRCARVVFSVAFVVPGPLGSCSPVCPVGVLFCLCGVLGHLAPVQQCALTVRCFACAVSWATWLLSTGVPARCVVLFVRCPRPFGSCSPVCHLGALLCVCSVLGHLARFHRCARSVLFCLCGDLGHLAPVHQCACLVCCVVCALSWANWLLFTGVPVRCVVLFVRCPRPLDLYSPVCPLGALLCVCGVLGLLAPVHRCARVVCCAAFAVPWATRLLFTDVAARCVALRVRCPGPLGSCSPVYPLGVLFCLCGVLGHLAPVHQCAPWVRCFACAVSWTTWLLFSGVPARCVVLRVRCPGPLGSGSPVCPLYMRCVACAVSWATSLLFTSVHARCVVLLVQCPGPLSSCSPVCLRGLLCCLCGVLGHLTPVHRCARSVCCVACAVSWATWLLFTSVPARCVLLLLWCPGPLGSCSTVCLLGALCCLYGVLGHLTPVHRCARSVCCFACAVSYATSLLFTSAPARCVALRVRCPGPLGSCSPVCPRGLLCCVCGVLGHLTPVHRVCARCVVLCVRCPGPLGSCPPVCLLGALFPLCGVLGHLATVHRCARSVCCVPRTVSWATWLLFTGVPASSVVLLVRCPGPLGSCLPVCPRGLLCCLCDVLGHLAPVHRCARSVRCVACTVSRATWLLFTGVPAWSVVLRVRCPGPLGSCSPVCCFAYAVS